MNRYLIIGNGVAGTTAAESIGKTDPDGKISIVTEEDLPFYYRIRLNEFISGDIDEEGLVAKKEKWYRDRNIDLHLNLRVVGADPEKKTISTVNGQTFPYDRLLIATGSHSFIPPITGSDKNGVFSLRSIKDARHIISFAKKVREIVVIGGGLLGLEAGNALRKLGKKVTVVEFFQRLLPRQLDSDGARMLQASMEGMGFSFRLNAKTQEILGEKQVKGVLLEGGEKLPGQMVIISAGVRPNMELADALGIEHDKGIKVDEQLKTSRQDIFAAGDVAEFRGMPYGIWPASMEQGKIAGTNMAGGSAVYEGTTMSNTLKVVEIDLASAGDIDAEGKFESMISAEGNIYKKLVIDNNRIKGCIMLGNTKGFNDVVRLMKVKKDVSQVKELLLTDGFDFKSV